MNKFGLRFSDGHVEEVWFWRCYSDKNNPDHMCMKIFTGSGEYCYRTYAQKGRRGKTELKRVFEANRVVMDENGAVEEQFEPIDIPSFICLEKEGFVV